MQGTQSDENENVLQGKEVDDMSDVLEDELEEASLKERYFPVIAPPTLLAKIL